MFVKETRYNISSMFLEKLKNFLIALNKKFLRNFACGFSDNPGEWIANFQVTLVLE